MTTTRLHKFRFAQIPGGAVPAPEAMGAPPGGALGGDPLAALGGAPPGGMPGGIPGDPMGAPPGGMPGEIPGGAPPGGDPGAGGAPGGDLGGLMGGGGPGGGPGGAAPMSAPGGGTEKPPISGPIDTLAQVLYDTDLPTYIQSHMTEGPEALALDVWKQYGGTDTGDVEPGKMGARPDSAANLSPEAAQNEQNATKDSKWLRLKRGTTIADITTLKDLEKLMEGLIYAVTMKAIPPPQQGGGGGGGGGPLAAAKARVIIASALDKQNYHKQADYLVRMALHTAMNKKSRKF